MGNKVVPAIRGKSDFRVKIKLKGVDPVDFVRLKKDARKKRREIQNSLKLPEMYGWPTPISFKFKGLGASEKGETQSGLSWAWP